VGWLGCYGHFEALRRACIALYLVFVTRTVNSLDGMDISVKQVRCLANRKNNHSGDHAQSFEIANTRM
jgi:hypothetical protein